MKLPDFAEFAPFQALRAAMQATEPGHFVFFDPVRHLTGDERLQLQRGLAVSSGAVRLLDDRTFAYKNARVLVWSADPMRQGLFHLCACEQFHPESTLVVGCEVPAAASVCAACLDYLQYEGHNSVRARHRDYYAKVRQQFRAQDFFSRYPHYPLPEAD